jgi:DNA-binding PadR family transcriptional regulator
MKNPRITGYDILHMTPETIHASIEMKTGTVYTELRRLEKFGFVRSIQSKEGRKSRHYEITTSGVQEIKALNVQIQNRINNLIMPLLELIESTLRNSGGNTI